MDTQLVMKIQDPGQCLLNSTALLFPLLLAFWCLPEEPGSAHCVFSSKPLCGQDFVYLTHLRTLRAWHIEVLKKYLSNGSLGK